MDPNQKRELKRQAFMRLAAQRRRAGRLRGRVVAISLICFVVLWGIVFTQMATGNDPVLGGKEKAVATRGTANAGREIETTEPRELEPTRETDSEEGSGDELEPEPEAEEAEPEVEEAEPVEAEPESVETEPLVTSQS